MSGYSGTPLPQKLGFAPGQRVAFSGAPAGFIESLALPDDVRVLTRGADIDLAMLFAGESAALRRQFPPLAARLASAGMLWVAWPKRASKRPTDLDENVVRGVGLEAGLVDVKVCAIDETWSGLKFVRRLRDRPRD